MLLKLHHAEERQTSPQSGGSFWQSRVLWRENLLPCIIYIHQTVMALNRWYRKLCDLASSCAVYFIILYVIGTPVFLFKCTTSLISCFNSWKLLCLGATERFLGGVHIYQLLFLFPPFPCSCFPQFQTFFLHCSSFFSSYSITISLNLHHDFAWTHFEHTTPL